MRAGRRLAVAFAWLVVPIGAAAQIDMGHVTSQYEMMYGPAVDVPLDEIASGRADAYRNRAVRTHGTLNLYGASRNVYEMRDGGAAIIALPTREIQESQVMALLGRDVEVVGIVREGGESVFGDEPNDPMFPPVPSLGPTAPRYSVTFWTMSDITELDASRKRHSIEVSLESLVRRPGERDGQTVRVVGKFRGRNLYGDLPSHSQRSRSDWVIKDDLFAVWVTGKKPKGSGWELDAGLKRDTGKWIEVVGRPLTRGGITTIQAASVDLTTAPTPTADAEPPPPPPPRPKVPPVVVFALPLDGAGRDKVPSNSQFIVQFSKDMDESTFAGHVIVRYAGPRRPGDQVFDGLKLTYDGGRRALTVDPGDVLRPGRVVELVLLPGIRDIEGLELEPRQEPGPTEGVDILRYWVAL
jgi:Bacterial Ig-like domain